MAAPTLRSLIPRLLIVAGFCLQLLTLTLLLHAGQQRELAQDRLNAQWGEVNAKAAKHNPPALPPAPPPPAPLPGVPLIVSVAALGSGLIIFGARLWAQDIKTRRASTPRPTALPPADPPS